MASAPVHLRWELAPVPHEKGRNRYGGSYLEEYEWWTAPRERSLINDLVYMFQEIFFLKGVWERNRRLWWFSFPFHAGLYLLILVAGAVLLGAVLALVGLPVSGWVYVRLGILALAGAGYGLGVLGVVGLLVMRLGDPALRMVRTSGSLFNLGFLLAVFLSGAYTLVAAAGFPQSLIGFMHAVLTADSSIRLSTGLAVHLVLVFLFVAYLPWTPMWHFIAKYFTYHQVRWDDESMQPGSRMEKQVLDLLQQPVTWSGPHLGADGKKNWLDIVTEKEEEEEEEEKVEEKVEE
jgi:nitrate reductase gamma subunit